MGVCLRVLATVFLAAATVPLLALALRSVRAAGHSLRLFRAVGRARRSDFEEVSAGPVALLGEALAIEPLVSEETGRRGVYLAYSADQWAASATIGGLAGHWLRSEQKEEAAPFELTDGRSSLLVDPRGAEIMRVPGVSLELTTPGGPLVRYREALIEERAQLLVVGHAEPHGGFEPSAAYRGHSYRVVITDGGRGELTIAPPSGLRPVLAMQALGRLAGVLPAVAALWLVLALLLLPLLS